MSSWREFRKTGSAGTPDRTRKLGLLVVDDEEAIVGALVDVFCEDFEIYRATSALEALRVFREHQPRVVLTDQRMPDMCGIELLRQVREINPDTVCMLLTGYSDINVVITALNEGLVWKYIPKPWDHDTLRKMVLEGAQEYLRRSGEAIPSFSFLGH